jgi:hypothetical protein
VENVPKQCEEVIFIEAQLGGGEETEHAADASGGNVLDPGIDH